MLAKKPVWVYAYTAAAAIALVYEQYGTHPADAITPEGPPTSICCLQMCAALSEDRLFFVQTGRQFNMNSRSHRGLHGWRAIAAAIALVYEQYGTHPAELNCAALPVVLPLSINCRQMSPACASARFFFVHQGIQP